MLFHFTGVDSVPILQNQQMRVIMNVDAAPKRHVTRAAENVSLQVIQKGKEFQSCCTSGCEENNSTA